MTLPLSLSSLQIRELGVNLKGSWLFSHSCVAFRVRVSKHHTSWLPTLAQVPKQTHCIHFNKSSEPPHPINTNTSLLRDRQPALLRAGENRPLAVLLESEIRKESCTLCTQISHRTPQLLQDCSSPFILPQIPWPPSN